LIARLDGMADRDPMNVVVDKDRVLITKGTNETVIGK
jgi:hypothetical protein